MSVRLVITDAMWDRIEPLMPADPVRGRRWADHRRTLEAIAWKYRTNSPWRDLPDELGSFQTAHKRLIRWAVDGTWERILAAVLAAADADDDLDWTVSVDSTVVRAHQHAAGARKKGRPAPPPFSAAPPERRTGARSERVVSACGYGCPLGALRRSPRREKATAAK
ncbi:IS5 family transposase [Streptomyces echinatus]|uniref:IS5 family transposase n=1 Tax=Streptomyces echinatus TaxID=67293 RepID=UPI0037A66C97